MRTSPASDALDHRAAPASRPTTLRLRARRMLHRYPYVFTCVGVTMVFLAIAQGVSMHIGVPIRDPEGALLGRRMISPVAFMILFAYIDSLRRAMRLRRGGTEGGLLQLSMWVFRERWWWKRLVLAIIGFLSFAFTYLAYRNLKSFVSLISYRSFDQELAAVDRWMLLGSNPSTVLHELLGMGWMAHVLSWLYLIYIPLVPITVSMAIAFVERMREAYVFVATYMWCWILGTASYYMIPTLGPFATRADLFDQLPYTPVTRLQEALMRHRFELHADNLGQEVVGGIAGFASLHVGVVVAVIMLMRYYRQTVLLWASIAFLVPTVLATIYFGWHFILDDIAGLGIGIGSFLLGRVTVYPRILIAWRHRLRHDHQLAEGAGHG